MEKIYDIVIVGAGVAGAAAATAFARQGRQVLLLERSLKEPDRIVGELLQPAGVFALQELGLDHCLHGIDSVPVKGYHIYWKEEEISFWYPPRPQRHTATSNIRAQGTSFHHGRFITNLRRAASGEENVTVLEATVTDLVRDEHSGAVIGVEAIDSEKRKLEFHGHLTIVSDGASSNLRRQIREGKPQAKSRFWGLELIDAPLPLPGLAHGVIGSGPPILIYQIGSRETRILIDIQDLTHKSIADVKTYIEEAVIPVLPRSLQPKVQLALQTQRLRSMPNQWLPPQTITVPGVILLGDSSNMRHPLTGGGMTVALKDVVLISKLLGPELVPLNDSNRVSSELRRFHWKRKRYCSSLNILAQALYTLFVADDPQLEIMQRGFVRYIQLGGNCVEQPAGLMGGIHSNPLLLFYHFFAVALYSMWLLIRQSTIWALPITMIKCVQLQFLSARFGTEDLIIGTAKVVEPTTALRRPPELLTLFAIMQWNAHISVREMGSQQVENWSVVHAFYANVGDYPSFPINATSLLYLHKEGRLELPKITRGEIWDKGKMDLFAKWFAYVQTAWLLCEVVGRAVQKLPITPFELFTIAFVIPTVATQYFWANKPQNSGAPVAIKVAWPIADVLRKAGDAASQPYVDTPLDFIEKPVWDGWTRRASLLHFGGLQKRPLARIPNDYAPPPPTGREAMFVWVISVLHAGIHLLGWDLSFPTQIETVLWRASSLALLVVMVVGGLVPVLSTRPWFDFSFNLLWIWVREAKVKTWRHEWLFASVVNFAYAVYILARLVIFAEIFSAFRSLPADTYLEVQWSAILPHL